jgi:cytochrome P450
MESVVDEFDHMSSDFANDVHGSFRRLREGCPVAYSEKHGGHWLLTRYDDVAAVLKDDVSFSSARPPGSDGVAVHIPSMPAPLNVPIELDPPESLVYRRLLHPFLSPAAVEARRPTIKAHVTRCVDAFIETGEGDLIMDLASQAPAFVIIDMIGLPLDYAPRFSTMMHALTSHLPHSPEWDVAVAEVPWALGVIADAIASRTGTGADGDLVSWLKEAQVDGQPISDETVQSMILLLIGGGVDTTTSLTGQAFMWLHQHPDKREWLRHNLDKIKWITEEFLRYSSPVTTQARTVAHEIDVDGRTLRPGDRVLMCLAAANHDPDQFPNPDEVLFDREINRHLAFGVGTHRCIGSNLARATFEVMVSEVLTRLPDYRIDDELATLYPAQGLVNGYVRLPATFTPGVRSVPLT